MLQKIVGISFVVPKIAGLIAVFSFGLFFGTIAENPDLVTKISGKLFAISFYSFTLWVVFLATVAIATGIVETIKQDKKKVEY